MAGAAPRYGNVRELHASGDIELLARDMHRRAGAGGGVGHLRSLLGARDELGKGGGGIIRADDEQ